MLRLHPPQHHLFWTAQAHVISSLLLARAAAVPLPQGPSESGRQAVMPAAQRVRCLTTEIKTKGMEAARGLATRRCSSPATVRQFSTCSKSLFSSARTISGSPSPLHSTIPSLSMSGSASISRHQHLPTIRTFPVLRRSMIGTSSPIQAELRKRGQTRQFHASHSRSLPAPAVIFAAGALLKVSRVVPAILRDTRRGQGRDVLEQERIGATLCG